MNGRHTDVEALRRVLAEADMTQTGLARAAGLGWSHVSKVLAHRRDFSDRAAHRVARAAGCAVDEFTHPGVRTTCSHCATAGQVAA